MLSLVELPIEFRLLTIVYVQCRYHTKYVPKFESQLYYSVVSDLTGQNAGATMILVTATWLSEGQTSYYFIQARFPLRGRLSLISNSA